MAPGLKTWLGLTAGGMLLVAVSALPPSSVVGRNTAPADAPEKLRYDALKSDWRRSEATLQRIRWSDSLSALALATAEDGIAVGGPVATVSREALVELRDRASAEVGGLARRAAGVTVGLFVQPNEHGAHLGDERVDTRVGDEIYIGARGTQAYCLRVRTAQSGDVNDGLVTSGAWLAKGTPAVTNILGPCAYVASYGVPGVGIYAWLERGGSDFAAGRADLPRVGNEWGHRRQLLGMRISSGSIELDQCIGGVVEACARVFARPDESAVDMEVPYAAYVVENSPATAIGLNHYKSPFNSDDDYILADLEREFGPERFAAFWSSDAEVGMAFESAFGLSAGEWIIGWMERQLYGRDHGFPTVLEAGPGPGLDSWSVIGGLLLVALSAILAGGWMKGRRVG